MSIFGKKKNGMTMREEYNSKCINFLETKYPYDTYSKIYEKIHEMLGECTDLRIGQIIENMKSMSIGETVEFYLFHSNLINSLNEGLDMDFFYEEPDDTFKRWNKPYEKSEETTEDKD